MFRIHKVVSVEGRRAIRHGVFAGSLLLAAAAVILSACASVQSSTVTTKSDYQKVWSASLDAVADI